MIDGLCRFVSAPFLFLVRTLNVVKVIMIGGGKKAIPSLLSFEVQSWCPNLRERNNDLKETN